MQLIQPAQISGEVMTLMDAATSRCIIVSPYYKLSRWLKIHKHIESLLRRSIAVECYVRADEQRSISEVARFGVEPIEVPRLHTKMYLNEEYGIVTSMNLHHGSDIGSLDIGYKTETPEEYSELDEYYERYLVPYRDEFTETRAFPDVLIDLLEETYETNVRLSEKNSELRLRMFGRTIDLWISNGRQRYQMCAGMILPNLLYEYLLPRASSIADRSGFSVQIEEGERGRYDMMYAHHEHDIGTDNLLTFRGQPALSAAEKVADLIAAIRDVISESDDGQIRRMVCTD